MLNCQGHERRLLQGTGVFVVKLVLIVLLLVIVFGIGTLARVFFRMLPGSRPNASRGLDGRSPSSSRFGNEEKVERMLACSVCGVHVPESEGIEAAGRFFCCEAHRK
ncbi:MAG: hypothetical protein FWH56_07925 [Betaproteobacteria bacterium]|nr:hypothetical protein [Betaproteobacteria bacterium]